MMGEYEHEPIRGLPGDLPPGERILWQGAPDWRTFALSGMHARWLGLYFAALLALSLVSGSLFALVATAIGGLVVAGLVAGFAALVARTTVYTITNRRVVLRIGVALNSCINLPLKLIQSADLRPLGAGRGEIALTLKGRHRLGYAMLWPHARPWRLGKPQPMLRALADAAAVAETLALACAAEADIARAAPAAGGRAAAPAPLAPGFREAAA